MTDDTLEPIDPREAMEMYLQECRGELSPNTIQAREYRLGFFIRWCEGEDNNGEPRITNLNEISGRDIHKFRNWRKQDINKVTLQTQLSDLRQLMKFCAKIDGVPDSMPDKIGVPVLEHGENQRETFIDVDEARTVIEYLKRYHYASLDHVLITLLWETGARISAIHSLDVGDVDGENEQLEFHHRPERGTRLKNADNGERIVTLMSSTLKVIEDYIEVNRVDMTDEYGREPLFTSTHGRMHKKYLPKRIYFVTRPCFYGQECPSGIDPTDCDHTGSYDKSVSCPHNTRPHDIRRGSITHWLREDVPEKVVSDRMDVSEKTLDRHYDQRTEQEKADQRRKFLENI